MITIRPYQHTDFKMIKSWWDEKKECPPIEGMMIPDGTFILEVNKVAALSLTVFLTQSKEIAMLEGFIKNPFFNGMSLELMGGLLWDHCFQYAKDKGYKRVVCYCMVGKLKEKYIRFGMKQTAEGLASFVKEL